VKAAALAMRWKNGIEVPGYELKTRMGKMKTLLGQQAIDKARTFGVSAEAIDGAIDVSIAKLGKGAHDAAPRGEKDKANKQFRQECLTEGICEEGESTPYLAIIKE